MRAIWKRELQAYFLTPTGYVFMGVFLLLSSVMFYLQIMQARSSDLPTFVGQMSYLWMLLSPVLTMRLLAEERQRRTDQLLLTSPVSVWGIVLGKFFAMAAVFALPCAVDAVMIFILWALGGTVSALIANLAGLLCYFLLGCAAIALCEFLSGLTENQIIAAVAGFSALLLAYLMPSLRSMFNAGSAVALAVFTGIAGAASLAAGLRTRSFVLGLSLIHISEPTRP